MPRFSDISRRTFIATAAKVVVAISVPLDIRCGDENQQPDPASVCQTSRDILGPFYRSNAPFRSNLIPDGNTTQPLILKGNVHSSCEERLQDAIVDIWNADENGAYDASDNFFFRGRLRTGADGFYQFTTIVPSHYLNGAAFRPSHIHLRVMAPGHLELISQIYFAEDPFIDDDPWAGSPDAATRILTIEKDGDNVDTVIFDIHLSLA